MEINFCLIFHTVQITRPCEHVHVSTQTPCDNEYTKGKNISQVVLAYMLCIIFILIVPFSLK